jgi:hypothetical protein
MNKQLNGAGLREDILKNKDANIKAMKEMMIKLDNVIQGQHCADEEIIPLEHAAFTLSKRYVELYQLISSSNDENKYKHIGEFITVQYQLYESVMKVMKRLTEKYKITPRNRRIMRRLMKTYIQNSNTITKTTTLSIDYMMIVGKYFESNEDFINLMKVCKKYQELVDMYHFNPIQDARLFTNHIQTQHFYGPITSNTTVYDVDKYIHHDTSPTDYYFAETYHKSEFKDQLTLAVKNNEAMLNKAANEFNFKMTNKIVYDNMEAYKQNNIQDILLSSAYDPNIDQIHKAFMLVVQDTENNIFGFAFLLNDQLEQGDRYDDYVNGDKRYFSNPVLFAFTLNSNGRHPPTITYKSDIQMFGGPAKNCHGLHTFIDKSSDEYGSICVSDIGAEEAIDFKFNLDYKPIPITENYPSYVRGDFTHEFSKNPYDFTGHSRKEYAEMDDDELITQQIFCLKHFVIIELE